MPYGAADTADSRGGPELFGKVQAGSGLSGLGLVPGQALFLLAWPGCALGEAQQSLQLLCLVGWQRAQGCVEAVHVLLGQEC